MSNFECIEHVVPCQHIRQYARSTARCQEDTLHLAVKQYQPRNQTPRAGDVTIIACHASAFPKELYEPLWDELYQTTQNGGPNSFRIRNIWIADVANQGASGVLNEKKLGNEPSYMDHARDLLLMTNHFRDQMQRPIHTELIVSNCSGIGHSMGGNIIVNLALLHPRLFTTIIPLEPVINKDPKDMDFINAYPLTFKKDRWASRSEAEASFRKSSMHKFWDPRTLQLIFKYGLREVPAAPQSDGHQPSGPAPVTLTTTRDQEVLSFARASYPSRSEPFSSFKPTRRAHPDLGPDRNPHNAFYRPEATNTHLQLQYLQPSCLYVYGERSHMAAANPHGRAAKAESTGRWNLDRAAVAEEIVKGASHFLVFEKPGRVAEIIGNWMAQELEAWRREEANLEEELEKIPVEERSRVDEDWRFWMEDRFGERVKKGQKKAPANAKPKPKL
ncbi:Abhydrolase domain-containing protein mpaH [Lachnellula suecica]|uniref:Abhydrolase domain-containing protein mpaH n=1 Tax=Lachnellula suecica TaxID=602035 RepID=A0A8T9C8M1_9HELO|nr:Abhydrolase domain-containing protein mpaH [Lachnellula suecica]